MRKTVALCLEYPLALRGGVSVLVETMLPAMKEYYDLVLVSPDAPGNLDGTPAAGLIKKHLLWQPDAPSRETARQLAGQLKDEGVDLAHFHFGGNFGWSSRLPGRCPVNHAAAMGVRTCSTVHLITSILDGYCGPQKPLWFKLALLPAAWRAKVKLLRNLHAEVAVSRHDAGKLRRWYWPVRGKFRVIYHSRVRQSALPAPVKREPMILNVGHIAARKGQLVLAEAFAEIAPRHPEWKLCLVGHFAEQEIEHRINEIARAHKLEERIVCAGARNDTMDFMNRAGIYVQPSYLEALGLALQEAMFTGCPSIGTRVGGIPELIDGESTGLLVPAGDVRAMARALERLISDNALRERFGRAAAASMIARGMTEQQMVAKYIELYESILGTSLPVRKMERQTRP
jgi:glycosyltransferase involved in cell wall biosynthesis